MKITKKQLKALIKEVRMNEIDDLEDMQESEILNEDPYDTISDYLRTADPTEDEEAASDIRRETTLSLATEQKAVNMLTKMTEMYSALPWQMQRPNHRVYRAIRNAYELLLKGSSGGSL